MNSSEAKTDRPLSRQPPIRRVGLLSPTSGNLGNAAMQAALISNLRKRLSNVEFVGITLNPGDTRRRLGIEAFPLAAVSHPHYGLYTSDVTATAQTSGRKPGKIAHLLKKIPGLRRFVWAVRTWRMELAHVAAAVRLVRKLDRLIVPGGGTLDDSWGGPWGQPWAIFKWSLISRACGVPFFFVSIGKSSVERPLSRFFFRIALRLAEYRSYRDNDSKIAAQGLVNASHDPVYPDLAFSYPYPIVQTQLTTAPANDRLVVGVSPIAYCDPRAWPQKDAGRYAAYLSQLAEMVRWLIKEGHRVLFFTTDSPDVATVSDLQAMLSAIAPGTEAIETLPGSNEQSPDTLLEGLSRADLVIASRLHGVILSHLNTIPVLAISFDPKVDAHMKAIGQYNYCLNIDHLQVKALRERFVALAAARHREQESIRSAALRFRQQLDFQYERIVGATPIGAGISSSPHTKPHQRRENVAHGASRGITAYREHAEPRSGDRRSAMIKTALSPLPGLFRRIVPAFSPRLPPWATRVHPHPRPLSRPAGEGCRRRGEGHSTQGLRPGLIYAAPDGAPKDERA
ncbi:MAG: polysaccharide pyruvyl transferase family protein [Terriglobia bacterium]